MIDVVWHEGKIYVAGTFNRRLCLWRLLTLFFPRHFKKLKVRFIPEREKQRVFTHGSGETKFNTECQGQWVEVRSADKRQRFYVGKSLQTDPEWDSNEERYSCTLEPGVQWPQAWKLLKPFSEVCGG